MSVNDAACAAGPLECDVSWKFIKSLDNTHLPARLGTCGLGAGGCFRHGVLQSLKWIVGYGDGDGSRMRRQTVDVS